MNELIEVRFMRKGRRLKVKRQLPGGIEFDEPDALERTIGVGFDARSDATRERMNSIRRIQGWEPGQFKLNLSVEDGSLILRGVNPHTLPEGLYKVQLEVEEARTIGRPQIADIDHDGKAQVDIAIEMDDRDVSVSLDRCDSGIRRVLEASTIDGLNGIDWIADEDVRATRRACLMNLLASARIRPLPSTPLLAMMRDVFHVANDRIYARVDRTLHDTLQQLAKHPTLPFFEEGPPRSPVHARLLDGIPAAERSRFGELRSFRSEGKPSMQVVVALPPPDLPHTYAEFDLDMGNPLQDILGFVVHMGELLDGKPTNHLDMRKTLAQTKAEPFLSYTIVNA